MQKQAFIALILAFTCTLSCAQRASDYTPYPDAWAKAPVKICEERDPICSYYDYIFLESMNTSDVTVFARRWSFYYNSWSILARTIDTTTLNVSSNVSQIPIKYREGKFIQGYTIDLYVDRDYNFVPQVFLYQSKVDGSLTSRFPITSNTNESFVPSLQGSVVSQKTIFIFSRVADKKVNVTTVTLGESVTGKEFTLSTNFTDEEVKIETGKALSSSQVLAGWVEGETYQVAVVDSNSGLISKTSLENYKTDYECSPYVTDLKHSGVYCSHTENDTLHVYVSTSSTGLTQLFTANATETEIVKVVPNAGQLAFVYSEFNSSSDVTTLYYEIWDLDAFEASKIRTTFLSYQGSSDVSYHRIPDGGVYVMVNLRLSYFITPRSIIYVGLLLDPSTSSLDSSDLSDFLAIF